MGTLHMHNDFYTVTAYTNPTNTLYRKLVLLNYGDTEGVLINHLHDIIPVIPMCPHKPNKHTHTQLKCLMPQ